MRGDRLPIAVLFDLDDTLVDRTATRAAFAAELVRRFEPDLRFEPGPDSPAGRVAAVIAAADGGGYAPRSAVFARLRAALPWATPPRPGALEAFWADAFPAAARPAAGLAESLDHLSGLGIRLGVVTNGRAAAQQSKLDAIGARRWFGPVVVSGAVGVRKPDPRVFALALGAMGVRAADAWFVGDHPTIDVLAARDAGLTAVWRRGSHLWPPDRSPPDHAIDRLTDLLRIIR